MVDGQDKLRSRSQEETLPAVTASVVESAVTLLKAELKLAAIESRNFAGKALVAVAWVLLAGFALQAAVAMLVLGPLLTSELSEPARWSLIIGPLVVAFALASYAFNSLRKVRRNGPQR